MSFADLGLAAPLLEAIAGLGYQTPTPVQEQAIPAVLAGRDLMAAAQTGTGKTAGFAVPLLQRLAAEESKVGSNCIRALVLVPTRELAEQVMESFRQYGAHLAVSSYAVYGGVSLNPQMMRLRRGVDVLVATPGRLIDLFTKNAVKFREVRTLVLDEADRMLDLGFADDLDIVFQALPKKRQTLLFSATFSEEIRGMAKARLRDPLSIEVSPRNAAAKTVKQWVVPVDKKRKSELFLFMRQDRGWRQVLVFVKTKKGCDELVARLQAKRIPADTIHGDRPQASRLKALEAFKAGEIEVLVATDVAARGLDIDDLPQVVNFDMPLQAEDYVHRIGRTGRAGQSGEAISFVAADEAPLLAAVETLIKQALSRDEEPGFEPTHKVPPTGVVAVPKKPKKPKVGAKGAPSNWVGFDDFPENKSPRRGTGRPVSRSTVANGRKPAAKPRALGKPRKSHEHPQDKGVSGGGWLARLAASKPLFGAAMSTKFPFKMLAIAAALANVQFVHAAGVTELGVDNMPLAISADGNVVVGQFYSPGVMTAAIWNGATLTKLPKPAGYTDAYALGASSDGKIVVGEASTFDSNWNYFSSAFKWTAAGGTVTLAGLANGQNSSAAAISADGKVIVGKATLADGVSQHAVRWVGAASTIQDINGGGFTYSSAQAVSQNGSVVVGYGQNPDGFRAFRWDSAGGMISLGVLSGKNASEATAVSADGQVVAGVAYTAFSPVSDSLAFRWTEAGGMVSLGLLAGTTTARATAINADGSVIVGYATDGSMNNNTAFRWTAVTNMQSVAQWLTDNKIAVGSSKFYDASGVSADGNVVVGTGNINGKTQGYIARVGAGGGGGGGSGVIGTTTLSSALVGANQSLGIGGGLASMAMFGAHHRVLADNGLPAGRCFWATGDLGGRANGDSKQMLGEIGACTDVGPLRVGLGIGANNLQQDLSFGGSTKFDGQHVYVEADYRLGEHLVASAAGFHGRWDAEISRRYLNGTNLQGSTGRTDVKSTAGRLRLDWLDLAQLGRWSMSPFVAYSHIATHYDAYTEAGGGFPLQYAAVRQTERDLRAGVTGKLALNNSSDLRLSAEAIHRLNDEAKVTASLVGAGPGAFSIAAPGVQENRARFGAEIDHRLSKQSVINASLHLTAGSEASYTASLGWKMGF